jgi:hypothetical protein
VEVSVKKFLLIALLAVGCAACEPMQSVAPSAIIVKPAADAGQSKLHINGSVVSILDHPQPVNHTDGSTVSILD